MEHLRAWSAGTHAEAVASGLPAQLEQLDWLEEGKARELTARNSPTRLLGGAGRRRPAALTEPLRQAFLHASVLRLASPQVS